MSEARIQAVERLFGTWLALSRDEDILILLARTQTELRRRRYDVVLEIARAATPEEESS